MEAFGHRSDPSKIPSMETLTPLPSKMAEAPAPFADEADRFVARVPRNESRCLPACDRFQVRRRPRVQGSLLAGGKHMASVGADPDGE